MIEYEKSPEAEQLKVSLPLPVKLYDKLLVTYAACSMHSVAEVNKLFDAISSEAQTFLEKHNSSPGLSAARISFIATTTINHQPIAARNQTSLLKQTSLTEQFADIWGAHEVTSDEVRERLAQRIIKAGELLDLTFQFSLYSDTITTRLPTENPNEAQRVLKEFICPDE